MKTAVSLPEDIVAAADALARKAGLTRSELYTEALREYVARHSPDDEVTARLDALYGEESSELAPELRAAARRMLRAARQATGDVP